MNLEPEPDPTQHCCRTSASAKCKESGKYTHIQTPQLEHNRWAADSGTQEEPESFESSLISKLFLHLGPNVDCCPLLSGHASLYKESFLSCGHGRLPEQAVPKISFFWVALQREVLLQIGKDHVTA
ncbi:hypothetical protein SRHO_G00144990 [Serrasalmus rhombeus]